MEARCVELRTFSGEHFELILLLLQVRDEHRQDYDAGRGGWGAQAQREAERRKEREEVYADAQDGPGAVAGGGDDWKQCESAMCMTSLMFANNKSVIAAHTAQSNGNLKRGRDDDDDDEEDRDVSRHNFRLVLKTLMYESCR